MPTLSTTQMFNQSDISTWTEADYERMLATVDANFLLEPGDPEFENIKSLIELVYNYEATHYPMPVKAQAAEIPLAYEIAMYEARPAVALDDISVTTLRKTAFRQSSTILVRADQLVRKQESPRKFGYVSTPSSNSSSNTRMKEIFGLRQSWEVKVHA